MTTLTGTTATIVPMNVVLVVACAAYVDWLRAAKLGENVTIVSAAADLLLPENAELVIFVAPCKSLSPELCHYAIPGGYHYDTAVSREVEWEDGSLAATNWIARRVPDKSTGHHLCKPLSVTSFVGLNGRGVVSADSAGVDTLAVLRMAKARKLPFGSIHVAVEQQRSDFLDTFDGLSETKVEAAKAAVVEVLREVLCRAVALKITE